MPLSFLKTKMNKQDVHTLIALRVEQNEENDVFIDEDSKKGRKDKIAKLQRKRETMLDKLSLSEDEIEMIKEKRVQSYKKMEENNAKFEEMKARAQRHANSFKSKPKIKPLEN